MIENLTLAHRLHGIRENFEYHSHPEYEVYIFHSGSCRYLIHDQIYDLKPGDVILMDGMTLHKPNVDPNSKYIRSYIHFGPELIKDVLETLGSTHLLDPFKELRHCLIRTNENNEVKELENIIRSIAEIRQHYELGKVNDEIEMKVLLLHLLINVYKLANNDDLKARRKKSVRVKHVESISTYIRSNYTKSLTLDVIAEDLYLSKSYVSHLFKEITGFTVMDYLLAYRLTRAKYLLETEPNILIKDIAYLSGFESASHFSRCFHNEIGMTAREYRSSRLERLKNEGEIIWKK